MHLSASSRAWLGVVDRRFFASNALRLRDLLRSTDVEKRGMSRRHIVAAGREGTHPSDGAVRSFRPRECASPVVRSHRAHTGLAWVSPRLPVHPRERTTSPPGIARPAWLSGSGAAVESANKRCVSRSVIPHCAVSRDRPAKPFPCAWCRLECMNFSAHSEARRLPLSAEA